MRGWTKLGAHARSSNSVLKTITVFFSGRYGFSVLPSSLQSAIYSCPRRTSRFLESVAKTRTTTTLAYKSRSFLPFSLSGAVSDTLRIYYTGLPCNLWLLQAAIFVIVSYACTCLDHELRTTWAGFCEYQVLPLLSGKSLGTRLDIAYEDVQISGNI